MALPVLLIWLAGTGIWSATPVITGPTVASSVVGAPLAYAIIASGSPSSFAALGLPAGLTLDPATGLITGTPTTAGSTTVTLSASNTSGTGTASLTLITVAAAGARISNAEVVRVSAHSACSFQLLADAANPNFLVAGLPLGLTYDSSGLISGTPTNAVTAMVTASADGGATATTLTFQILTAVTGAPGFALPIQPVAAIGAPFACALSADGATSFACSNLPGWLGFGVTSGLLSGTPASGAASVNLRLTASTGPAATTTVLAIPIAQPAADASLPASPAVIDATVGSGLGWRATATVAGTTFTDSGFPTGLSLNGGTGILSGIPSSAGNANVIISAVGGTTTVQTTIAVRVQAAVTGAPTINPIASANLTVGAPAALAVSTSGEAATAFSLSDASGSFAIDGTDLITGTPAAAGLLPLRVTATNAAGSAVTTVLAIANAATTGAPMPSAPVFLRGTTGSACAAAFAASDSPTGWTVAGLPSGLALAPNTGTIAGTPNLAGDYNLALSPANALGSNPTSAVLRVVAPATGAPVIAEAGPWYFGVGQAGRIHLSAIGASAWTCSTLPTGLTLDAATGIISGSATTAGTTCLTITANAGALSTSTTGLLIIEAATTGAPALTNAGTLLGTVDKPFSAQLTASGGALSFTAAPLPAGLSLDSASGSITGTPITSGITSVQISASNPAGTTRSMILIDIQPASSSTGTTTGPTVSGVSGGCGSGGLAAGCLVLALRLRRRQKDFGSTVH